MTFDLFNPTNKETYRKYCGKIMFVTLTWSNTKKYGNDPTKSTQLIEDFFSYENFGKKQKVFMKRVSDIISEDELLISDYKFVINPREKYVTNPSSQECEEKVEKKRISPKNDVLKPSSQESDQKIVKNTKRKENLKIEDVNTS